MSVLFMILAILAGLFGTLLFGYIGLAVTAVFAVLSVLFAIRKRKNTGAGGVASIVLSVIAVLISVSLAAGLAAAGEQIKKDADKAQAPLLKKYAPSLKYGVVGMLLEADKDGVDWNELEDDFDSYNNYVKDNK
ncbi:MAG: hypothetical protein K5848_04135 [Lachnospiraceae bacterium]|nr:hypothetical protein [Lachnospiraceae bacterium]